MVVCDLNASITLGPLCSEWRAGASGFHRQQRNGGRGQMSPSTYRAPSGQEDLLQLQKQYTEH